MNKYICFILFLLSDVPGITGMLSSVYQWNRTAKVQHATCQLLSAFPDIQNEEAQVIKTLGMNFGTNSVVNYSDM